MGIEHGSSSERRPEEQSESEAFDALTQALTEEHRVLAEIREVFQTQGDRANAERIVLQDHAAALDDALRKSREAMDRWLGLLQKP